MEEISQDDIIQIMKMLEESTFEELRLQMGDLKLVVRKGDKKAGLLEQPQSSTPEPEMSKASEKPAVRELKEEKRIQESPDLQKERVIAIKAPMLGTFYRAPKPGAPQFVQEGQLISPEETVCIIEVMKLFNTVKAGVRGRIAKICAENGQMVEYQQTLFLVEEVEAPGHILEGRTS